MRVFGGSYIDGTDVDLAEWAGLALSDEEQDRLMDADNPEELIGQCSSAEVVIDEAIDYLGPGQNDTFYSVHADEVEVFRAELRNVILSIVKDAATAQSDAR